jgi:hypothetical protein
MCNEKVVEPFVRMLPDFIGKFNDLSAVVYGAGDALGSSGKEDSAEQLEQLRALEQRKFLATMHLYTLRKTYAFEEFEWQHDAAAGVSGACPEHASDAGVNFVV